MRIKLLATLLILATFSVHARTMVYFKDACSQKEVKVSTPNGVRLGVQLEELNPDEGVELTITIRPALPPDQLQSQDKYIVDYYIGTRSTNWRGRELRHVDEKGVFAGDFLLPSRNWMRKVEERHNNYSLWDAEIKWRQVDSRKMGTSFTTFYNSPSQGPYFQMLSEKICHWQSEASVASKIYENPGPQNMKIIKHNSAIWDEGASRGMTLGYNNFQGNAHPLSQFSISSTFLGWLFKDWQTQMATHSSSSIDRTYTLERNEAGLFISRMSFNRHKARRFEWDPQAGSCGDYIPVSEGILDVGNVINGNFVVIPQDFVGHPQKVSDFINRTVAPIKNCSESSLYGADYADDIILSGKNGILFYYLQDESLGGL